MGNGNAHGATKSAALPLENGSGGSEGERRQAGSRRSSALAQTQAMAMARNGEREGRAVGERDVDADGAAERALRPASVRLPEGVEPAY